MYNKRLRSLRSSFPDQTTQSQRVKINLNEEDSSKHSSDINAPRNNFNIKPLKKIEESKSEVSNSKEEVKEIKFYFNDSSE